MCVHTGGIGKPLRGDREDCTWCGLVFCKRCWNAWNLWIDARIAVIEMLLWPTWNYPDGCSYPCPDCWGDM